MLVPLPHDETQPDGLWRPRKAQVDLWRYLEGGGLRAVEPWHRRLGKDEVALAWTAVAAHRVVGNYWHMLPIQNQARRAIWDAVDPRTGRKRIDMAFPKSIRSKTRSNDMTIEFLNGSMWQVLGSDNYDALVGAPPVGIVFSEYALADPAAWAYLRPILAENGGWALFIGTVRGRNHFHRMHVGAVDDPNWHTKIISAEDTDVFTEEQLAREKRELIRDHGEDLGTAMFEQEYLCSFDSAIIGSYYGKQMREAESSGRVTDLPYIQDKLVTTAWDIGVRDATAIWFLQRVDGWVHAIDYLEMSNNMGLPEMLSEVKDRGYQYGKHFAPHDMKVREFGTGNTRLEAAQALGVNFEVAPMLALHEGIKAVRDLLPKMKFDRKKTERGVNCLINYRTEYDQKNHIMKSQPLHDWSSHGADSLRTYAVMPDSQTSDDFDWGPDPDYSKFDRMHM